MTEPVQLREDLLSAMQLAVPAGQEILSAADIAVLSPLTNSLVDVAEKSGFEALQSFQTTQKRGLQVNTAILDRAHRDATILVTGGTGCIGSSLLAEISRLGPKRLVSISRGVSDPWATVDGVEYHHVDIRDRSRLLETIADLQPNIVYHLAAQHNPGLAEKAVAQTLSTNVLGCANILLACKQTGARLVHASTGKALRPFSSDVYAVSKKMCEWLVAQAVSAGELQASAARFTHVVDNSIIASRLGAWTDNRMPMRLHSPDAAFYVQSAFEAAQLLMTVGLESLSGKLHIGAIRDLGWPIQLVDLAVGWLSNCPEKPPIYFCGFEAGYEDNPYPPLYDPRISGERSPLLNGMEVAGAIESRHTPEVDLFAVQASNDTRTTTVIEDIGAAAAAGADPTVLRAKIRECGWAMLAGNVESVPTAVLSRHLEHAASIPLHRFSTDDRQVVAIVRSELNRRTAAAAPTPVDRFLPRRLAAS